MKNWAALFLGLVVVDQVVVTVVYHAFPQLLNGPEAPRWFSLVHFPGSFIAAAIVLAVLFFHPVLRRRPLSLALIGAGLVSNILTYAHFGYVVDYLRLPTTTMNLADIFITIGCCIAVVALIKAEA